MADASVDTDALTQLAAKLDGLTGDGLKRIDRAGLRAVNQLVQPELIAATPEAAVEPTAGSTALPKGALRGSVRARILPPRGALGSAGVIDFGKNDYVANLVDAGHAVVKGGYSNLEAAGTRRGPGKVTSNVPGTGFVRAVQDKIVEEAAEVYVAAAGAEAEAILNGK